MSQTDKMQAELYKSRETIKQMEIEIAQMTFSRDEAKEALKEGQGEKRNLLSKLEKESISLFKSNTRIKELEKAVGVWKSNSDLPVHEKFVQETKNFEQKMETVTKTALQTLLHQENKLSKTSSHLYILRNMVRFNTEKLNQKDSELREDKVKYQTIKQEYERVVKDKDETSASLLEAKENLSMQATKVNNLEESLTSEKMQHQKTVEKIKYLEMNSERMRAELTDTKASQKEIVKKYEDQQKTALKTQYELQAAQQSESRLTTDNRELRTRRKALEEQLGNLQKEFTEFSAAQAQSTPTLTAQSTPLRPMGGMMSGRMTASTPGTKLLGTIDSLFSGQASGAPALETGNRLRSLSQVLQKGNRQLKRLKALVSSSGDDMTRAQADLTRAQADRVAASIATLEDDLPDLVNAVRALAIDVSGLGRYDAITPEFQQRVEDQEQATSKWELEVHQVIEAIRAAQT